MNDHLLDEIAPGLYIRRHTPRHVRLTPEFVRRITEGTSETFKKAIERIVKEQQE
jgi:hypothetical protein